MSNVAVKVNQRRAGALLGAIIIGVAALLLVFSQGASPTAQGDLPAAAVQTKPSLIFTEFMPSNESALSDEDGDYPRWVEIHNTGDVPVSLSGWGLTDKPDEALQWLFPNVNVQADGYVVVYLSKKNRATTRGELHTSFGLSDGETLALITPEGAIADALIRTPLADNHSIIRMGDGAWEETDAYTPGMPNTAQAHAAYLETRKSGVTGLYINELMASNKTTVRDAGGLYTDWIEIYNASDAAVDLSGFGLSKDPVKPMRWTFPQGTVVQGRGYLLVFASDAAGAGDAQGELRMPYNLSAYQGTVTLSDASGRLIDRADYGDMDADMAYARRFGQIEQWEMTDTPTPGFENTTSGYTQFMESQERFIGALRISQVMTDNKSYLKSDDGGYYDWITLYNESGSAIDLSAYGLSDNPKNPVKWRFPQGASIAPGAYLTVLASGRDIPETDADKPYYETNFSLSADGEVLTLADADGVLVDKLRIPALPCDVSYGRTGLKARVYDAPTPGKPTGEGYAGITYEPVFLTKPGVYNNAIEIEIEVREGETVYYTTDCSAPTAQSTPYTGAIRADKNTVVRAIAIRDGFLTGYTNSGTYLFTGDGVNHSLPIATLVADPKDLWDKKVGIYAAGENFDPEEDFPRISGNYYKGKGNDQAEWERSAHFAVFGDDGMEAFSQNVGMRIGGSYGRGHAQKGLNLLARSEEGSNRMEYAFFEERPFDSYKALTLRAGGQDQAMSKIRDELATGLLEGSDVNFLYQAYEPYVLYLNGEYWGVYFLKEKRNRFFVADHEGGDPDDLDLIGSTSRVYNGSSDDWKDLMGYIASHSLSNADAYDYIAERIDLNSFMDYMICEIYVAQSDVWNIQYYKLPGGKWKWIYYDFCWSWGNTENGANHQTLSIRRLDTKPCSDLFNALLKNESWRDAFIRRFAYLMETVYNPTRVNALIDELAQTVKPELAREREKFNGSEFMGIKQAPQSVASSDVEKWESQQIKRIRDFANTRPASIKKQIQKEFNLSDSYMREVFGE